MCILVCSVCIFLRSSTAPPRFSTGVRQLSGCVRKYAFNKCRVNLALGIKRALRLAVFCERYQRVRENTFPHAKLLRCGKNFYRIPHPRWSQLLLDYPKDDEQQVNVITARLFGDVFMPPARLLKKKKKEKAFCQDS